jgi:hypothetical protein
MFIKKENQKEKQKIYLGKYKEKARLSEIGWHLLPVQINLLPIKRMPKMPEGKIWACLKQSLMSSFYFLLLSFL